MLTDKQIKEMAFYITNNMEDEQTLSQDVSIIAIESIVRQLIREFFEKMVSCRRCIPEANSKSQGPLPQKAPCADKKS